MLNILRGLEKIDVFASCSIYFSPVFLLVIKKKSSDTTTETYEFSFHLLGRTKVIFWLMILVSTKCGRNDYYCYG
jgi:hypothetical protein